MTQIRVDTALRGMLQDFRQPLELWDGSGEGPGTGHSRSGSPPSMSVWNPNLAPRNSDGTLREEPDYGTAEVLARLEKL